MSSYIAQDPTQYYIGFGRSSPPAFSVLNATIEHTDDPDNPTSTVSTTISGIVDPTEERHATPKKYVDEQIAAIEPISITINAGEGSLTPSNDLATFYQVRVRFTIEQILQETDGVTIREFAIQSDFVHYSLETMDLNELVELLTHVAVVGR